MYEINKKCTKEELEYVSNANTILSKKTRINKLFGIGNSAMSVEKYIETNYPNNNEIKCNFCGSIKKIDSYQYELKNSSFFITSIERKNNINVCNRPSKEVKCSRLKYNTNSKEYVKIAYGLGSLEEANIVILNRNKSPFYRTNFKSEEEYINSQRRGEDFYGKERFIEIKKTISLSNSLKGYIAKYGKIEGTKKFKAVCKSKDSSSLDFFNKKHDKDEALKKYQLKKDLSKQSKENFINRYGIVEGPIKYNIMIDKRKHSNSLKGYIEKYGKIEGTKKFKDISKSKDTMSVSYFIRKYGEQWEIERNKRIKKFLFTYNGKASKESLENLFNSLVRKIKDYGILYFLGVEGNNEYFIYDNKNKKFNLYDFAIPSLKVIVEYHGSLWHYNEKVEYKKDKFGPSVEEMKYKDKYKRELAISKGFTYIEVFDTDNFKSEIIKIVEIIKTKINEKSTIIT